MKMKQVTGQALRVMVHLAEKEDFCSREEICEATQVPTSSLPKIEKVLHFAGMIQLVRGQGVCLARPSEEISFWDIFVVFEGEFDADSCGICSRDCTVWKMEECPLRTATNRIGSDLKAYLSDISLKMLIKRDR